MAKTLKKIVVNGVEYEFENGGGQVGPQGPQGETGPQGNPGRDGVDGKDGRSPEITIGENGNWFIDGEDTGTTAKGVNGADGADGENGKDGLTTAVKIGDSTFIQTDGIVDITDGIPGAADLSAYLKTVDADAKYATATHAHAEYLTEHQSLEDYAKKTDIPSVVDFIKKDVDNLTNYTDTTTLNTALAEKVNVSDYNKYKADHADEYTTLNNKVNTFLDEDDTTLAALKELINAATETEQISELTKLIGEISLMKYEKPTNGIPKNHLDTTVQDSLDKADTALQVNDLADYAKTAEVDKKQNQITETNKLDATLVQTSTDNTFVSASEKSAWNAKQAQITEENKLAVGLVSGLANVATSGSYNDLTDTPAEYELTKAKIEDKLTGNIESHTHDQYLTEHQSLADYATKSEVQDVSELASNASSAAAAARTLADTKYLKPTDGIPKDDLAEAVKTSLDKADTALQSVPSTYQTKADADEKYATKEELNLRTPSWSKVSNGTIPTEGVYRISGNCKLSVSTLNQTSHTETGASLTNTIFKITNVYKTGSGTSSGQQTAGILGNYITSSGTTSAINVTSVGSGYGSGSVAGFALTEFSVLEKYVG